MTPESTLSHSAQFVANLQPLMDAANDAMILLDEEWRIAAANDRMVELYGYSGTELPGKPLRDLQPPDASEILPDVTGLSGQSGSAVLETVHQKKDGSRIAVETSVRNVDAAGRTWRMMIIRDVTRREGVERELHEHRMHLRRALASVARQEELLRVAGEIAHVGGWDFNPETMQGSWTEEIARIHEVEHTSETSAIFGLQFYEGEHKKKIEEAVNAAIVNGTPYDLELELVAANGKRKWVRTIGHAVIENGKVKRVRGAMQDITERKHILDELRESRDQLKVLAASLQDAREDERAAVARELHDDLGQILTALKLDVAMVEQTFDPVIPPEVKTAFRRQIADVAKTIDGGVQELRRIIRNLRPEVLDTLGLVAALQWFGEDFQKRTGVTCAFRADRPASRIPSGHSTALFRIYQEILTNVTKHANATAVDARLQISSGEVTLTVADDGRGFDPAKPSSHTSLGMLGMRERAMRLGGTTRVESQPGKGTRIHIAIPLPAASQ
ncbi:MAG: PAS domain S-box protein [Bacteroidetes bacterium]|nr:PAS domain S-box protein [Bacteroidota bacterium]